MPASFLEIQKRRFSMRLFYFKQEAAMEQKITRRHVCRSIYHQNDVLISFLSCHGSNPIA